MVATYCEYHAINCINLGLQQSFGLDLTPRNYFSLVKRQIQFFCNITIYSNSFNANVKNKHDWTKKWHTEVLRTECMSHIDV